MNVKKFVKAGWRFITDKNYRFLFLAGRGVYDKMPDEEYLKKMFKAAVGYDLNLENPQTFNEKLQWLKLYNRKPEYTLMVDKYLVKDYVAGKIGEQYIIPTIGVYDSPDEIDFDKLPNQFVLKCNHNSGLGMYICKDKSKLTVKDIRHIKKGLRKGLAQDYYLHCREWPYKDVKRKIIAEKYMEDNESGDLLDYKFFCFNGEVGCTMTCSDRFNGKGLKVTFYDKDWNPLPFRRHYPASKETIKKPVNYQKMIELAERLSREMPFERVDFYEINGQVYFGELTLSPGAGLEEFEPSSADLELGKWIKLPDSRGGSVLIELGSCCLFIHLAPPNGELSDYKVMCFNGEPKLIQVHRGRFTKHTQDYYDASWNKLPILQGVPSSDVVLKKPEFLEEMLSLSRVLSKGMPHVRIDWYHVNGHLYFGEITFFDGGGYCEFEPAEFNRIYGDWIDLKNPRGGTLNEAVPALCFTYSVYRPQSYKDSSLGGVARFHKRRSASLSFRSLDGDRRSGARL